MLIKRHFFLSTLIAMMFLITRIMIENRQVPFMDTLLFAFLIVFVGFVIDVDHVLDIYLNYGEIPKSADGTIAEKHRRAKKLYIIFHSYEFMIIFMGIYVITTELAFIFMAVSFGVHLIIDTITNEVRTLAYSLLWRWRQNFDGAKIHLPEKSD